MQATIRQSMVARCIGRAAADERVDRAASVKRAIIEHAVRAATARDGAVKHSGEPQQLGRRHERVVERAAAEHTERANAITRIGVKCLQQALASEYST